MEGKKALGRDVYLSGVDRTRRSGLSLRNMLLFARSNPTEAKYVSGSIHKNDDKPAFTGAFLRQSRYLGSGFTVLNWN